MTNAVMLTSIPTGIVSADASTGATVASLSVYVTPQITDTSLATVPAFVDWPSVVAGLTFSVQFRGTSPSDPRVIASLDPNPKYAANRFDSALWSAIFLPQTAPAVAPWSVQDLRASGVLSYRTRDVSSAVKAAYKSTASLTTRPAIVAGGTDVLSKRAQDIAAVLPSGPGVTTAVKSAIGATGPRGVQPSLSGNVIGSIQSTTTFPETAEFARAAAFHNRNNYRGIAPSASPTAPPAPDFHKIVGHLADHPAILRRLGLIIDLVLVLPHGLDGLSNVFVQPTAAIAGIQVNHPWTYCVLQTAGGAGAPAFRPFYGDAESSSVLGNTPLPNALVDTNGLMRLDNENAAYLDDLDIDHAVTEVSQFAEKATKDLGAQVAVGGPSSLPVVLPALRTTGFALHQPEREGQIGLRFQDTASWNPNATLFLAENLVRGYRVDVRPAGGAWSSLCLRQTTFTFTNGHAPVTVAAPDEGYVKASAMSTATDEPIHNVHESLFHWDGWSLVASRPGLSVGPLGAGADGPVAPANSGSGLGFTSTIVAQPGSLTKLRFGTSYQFRARAVDLCGNDMRDATPASTQDHPSPAKRFTRYEPVAPPVLQIRKPVTEGESVERLVIRSDPYAKTPLNAAAWAAANNVAPPGAPAGAPATMGMNPYYPTSERHVAPPKASVQLAEYHGAIDAAVGGLAPAARAQAAWSIVSKEDGGFYDRFVTDSTTGQYRTFEQPGRSIVTPPFSAPSVALAQASGQPAFTGNQDIVPRGSALQPGQYVVYDADSVMLPYLPDPNASGIALQGLGATPVFRTYGARATNPSGGAWPELAPFRIVLNESTTGVSWSGLAATPAAASGATTISLPPATQIDLTYSSSTNDPTVHAFGPAGTSDPSMTSAQRGLLPALSPPRALTLVHAVQRPQAPVILPGEVAVIERIEGETAQTVQANVRFDGASSGRVDVVASWIEYDDSPNEADPTLDPSTHPVAHSGAIATFTPAPNDTSSFQVVRQLFGDTKRRDVTYGAVATTRFREYFPSSITSDASNITSSASPPAPIVSRSSARPPVPRVLYAVPSFTFSGQTSGSTTTRTRSGGTVRVYVDRGWFASGADERLGLVLARAGGGAPSSLVSIWGADPIWRRTEPGTLDTTHLLTADVAEVAFAVPLAEGAGTVDVATYKPNFNAARGLWYFDIGISPGQSYFPFLRLALARYQPESIGSLHMSRVVCTDFVQLAADRTASVVAQTGGNYAVSLTGPTAPNLKTPGAGPVQWASGHTVTAEFQEATTTTPDPIDWKTIAAPVMLAPSQLTGVDVTYQASLTFPTASATAGSKHRILLREYEVYASDAAVADGIGVLRIGDASTSYRTRLVYTDAVAISS